MKYLVAITIVSLCFFNNPDVLNYVGYPIDVNSYGASPFKIMPSTYLVALIALLQAKRILSAFNRSPRAVKLFFFVSFLVTALSNILSTSKGNIYLLNVLVTPVMFYLILLCDDPRNYRFYFHVLLSCFLLNSFIALYEKITLTHIISQVQQPEFIVPKDVGFRSSALMGHPLNNAFITSFLSVFFYVSFKKAWWKYFFLLTGLAAIMCFGARAALISTVLAVAFLNAYSRKDYRGSVSFLGISRSVLLSAPLIVLIVIALNFTDLGTRILRFGLSLNDDSSLTRFQIFDLFNYLGFWDLTSGLTQKQIESIMYKINVEIIENFWIVWLLKYGIFIFLALCISFIAFLRTLVSRLPVPLRYSFLFVFLVVASSNNSLATSSAAAVSIFVFAVLYTDRQYQNEV